MSSRKGRIQEYEVCFRSNTWDEFSACIYFIFLLSVRQKHHKTAFMHHRVPHT